MNNKDNNNEFPSILKYTFLYVEYFSKSKIVIKDYIGMLKTNKKLVSILNLV